MSGITCICSTPSFGNPNRPPCVVEQGVLAFPIFMPRYKSDGTRNTIDLAADPLTFLNPDGDAGDYATLGDYIRDRCENPLFAPEDRFYPIPKVENATFERTETVYETAPSQRKVKIDGVGGIRTITMELWADDAVHGMQRELDKFGCSDLDFFYVDISGNIWGIKDDPTNYVIRGYEMDTVSYDVFRMYATDTTTQKIMISWDLDRDECEENAYAVTVSELGYKANTLKSPIGVMSVVTNPTTTTILVRLFMGFGTAKTPLPLQALLNAAFVVTSDVGGVLPHVAGTVESPAGSYLITMDSALTSGHVITITTTATGYDVQDAIFTVA